MSLRGRRSRNKVSVGEPADGSLTQILLNVTGVLGVWGEYLFSPPPLNFLPTYILYILISQQIENFQRWISWFPYRWRTQRNAICNANCRIPRVIRSLNAARAEGISFQHVCFSVYRLTSNSLMRLSGILYHSPVKQGCTDQVYDLTNWSLIH